MPQVAKLKKQVYGKSHVGMMSYPLSAHLSLMHTTFVSASFSMAQKPILSKYLELTTVLHLVDMHMAMLRLANHCYLS